MFMGLNTREIGMDSVYAETVLTSGDYDFSAKYLAAAHIHGLAVKQPGRIGAGTIAALENLFYNRAVLGQTQAYFLLREAAGALCSVISRFPHEAGTRGAHHAVMNLLGRTKGHAQRAAAEALGTLPFALEGPSPRQVTQREIPLIRWRAFLKETRISCEGTPRFLGRSLVAKTADPDRLLVVKLAGAKDNPESLIREAAWLTYLAQIKDTFPVRFHVPESVPVQDRSLFRLTDFPAPDAGGKNLHLKGFAIAFLAHPDYFDYPNHGDPKRRLRPEAFLETICRNAFLFGRLTGRGMIHQAPVPLFHNRVQGPRRNDRGVYLWQRGGRLDQWLASCRYPNFGCSGVRDFEHLEVFSGPREIGLSIHGGAAVEPLTGNGKLLSHEREPEKGLGHRRSARGCKRTVPQTPAGENRPGHI